METKRMILGILLITALGLGWQMFLMHEYKVNHWALPDQTPPATPASVSAPTTGPSNVTPPEVVAVGPVASQPAATQSAGPWHLAAAQTATTQPIVIGSDIFQDSHY